MKISVVTVCYNAADTIKDTLVSVASQTHSDIEHIVVDGNSSDGTQEIVREWGKHVAVFVSEEDRGLYDAMNKAIDLARGDYIGFLHADDVFADENVISRIAEVAKSQNPELILSDVEFVKRDDPSKRVRFYSPRNFETAWLYQGDMPPQPGTYHRRDVYRNYGNYDLNFSMSSDFDFFLRLFCIHKVGYVVAPILTVRMRLGGKSSQGIKSNIQITQEVLAAGKKNGINITWFGILKKYLRKLAQFERVRLFA